MTEMKKYTLEGEYATVEEYAKEHGIVPRTLRLQIKEGRFNRPWVKISRLILIKL